MTSVIDLLKSHRSIRKFTSTNVEQSLINNCIEAGQAAATSSFIQACTVIQVNNKETRSAIAAWAGNQAYVEQAPVFLVFCADMQRHQLACSMNNAEMKAGYTEQLITATADCALFAQNTVIAAESEGLGTVYIGGIRTQIDKVTQALNLPHLVYPVFGLCLGYPDQDPEVKPRLPLDVVLKQDTYDDSHDIKSISAYDEAIRTYYQNRSGGQKDMSWSEQISGMLQKEARPHMHDFLQQQGYLKK